MAEQSKVWQERQTDTLRMESNRVPTESSLASCQASAYKHTRLRKKDCLYCLYRSKLLQEIPAQAQRHQLYTKSTLPWHTFVFSRLPETTTVCAEQRDTQQLLHVDYSPSYHFTPPPIEILRKKRKNKSKTRCHSVIIKIIVIGSPE